MVRHSPIYAGHISPKFKPDYSDSAKRPPFWVLPHLRELKRYEIAGAHEPREIELCWGTPGGQPCVRLQAEGVYCGECSEG